MTPEEYFAENPDVAVLAQGPNGFDYSLSPPQKGVLESDFLCLSFGIDWTGYDRRIVYNPNFQWGKRRKIEWGPWLLREPGSGPSPGNDACELQSVSLPDGWTAYRYGDYVDAPVDPGTFKFTGKRSCQWCGKQMPACDIQHHELFCDQNVERVAREKELEADTKPELSRFLPDGWRWVKVGRGWGINSDDDLLRKLPKDGVEAWHRSGLLHPSEGGGFQRHKPGDKMPDDAHYLEESGIVGWRPPFQQTETE